MSKPASIPPESQPTSYTIPQLAKRCNMTRWRMERYLVAKGVVFHRCGNTRIVWLSEITDKAGELLRSIRRARLLDRVDIAERED